MLSAQESSDAHSDVIVVDDEPAIVAVVQEALEDVHIAAEGCTLGWTAHACIRAKHPKVVILDVAMPGVNGIELFHLLRADPETRDIPVIFSTAYPTRLRTELPNLETMGAELLPKPFDIYDLEHRVAAKLVA